MAGLTPVLNTHEIDKRMTNVNVITTNPPHISELRRTFKVMFSRWVVVLGTVIIIALILVALLAPFLAPYEPNEQHLTKIRVPPGPEFKLGTDDIGRDVLSRLIYGSRISLLVGIVAITIAGIVGVGLGLTAGYFGGWTQSIIMRIIDALMAIPPIILILSIASVLGAGLFNVLIAIGVGLTPTYTRLMCGQIMALKENDYVIAARSIGASNLRIMLAHLLPNSFPPMLVLITLNMGTAILMEATVSFLGIGIAPPTATWGSMINTGYAYVLTDPLLSFLPGVAILLVCLAFNMVGDGLRDALDPRLRGTL
jgi:peptide/nickel transport system permease protein